jgi:hypothetical protein
MTAEQAKAKIADALACIDDHTVGGEWHKQWVLDQVVRILAGRGYEQWVEARVRDGYTWDTGVAP